MLEFESYVNLSLEDTRKLIMLNITREFLIKAHNAFNESGYRPDHLNYDHFCKCATKTLNRTEELQDAIEAAKLWQFVNIVILAKFIN